MSILLAALLLASALPAQTPQDRTKTAPQQGLPPKNLTVRADGHVTANQDPAHPDTFEVHIVKPGESLWLIAGQTFKNPRLWPQLWEQNEHIINPHWIYPNDKILIRPVTSITEARPTDSGTEAGAELRPLRREATAPEPAAAPTAGGDVVLAGRTPVPEVKFDDLYCSGFLRMAPLAKDLNVISRVDATGGVLAAEADYVYLSQGSEEGIRTGTVYQAVRPTRTMNNPYGRTKAERELGMHYLDIAQLRVVLAQPHFSLARVMHSCSDAVEVGDILMPFKPIVVPAHARSRPFSSTMETTSGVSGMIVSSKTVLLNFGSTFKLSSDVGGVHSRYLDSMKGGFASDGSIVYIAIGQDRVKTGDIFIAYRDVVLDGRLYDLPTESGRLKGARTAIGELIVLKVGERGSTALVTYASDALALGDAVERR